MSTVKANTYQDASGGNTATINSMTPTADSLQGFRNRIINGDMRIDQRNAGASISINNTSAYTVDRWQAAEDADGVISAQQNTSAPTGFVNSLKITTTTADATLGATQYALCSQAIEGTNISDLAWGTASAKTVTLSFWVRSSLTGTFGGSLRNSAYNRSYVFTYSISVADTWEYKTVTITGDTSGTWETNTNAGIILTFGLGVGSTYSGTAGSWSAASYGSATGATSVIGTLNATWYITGVQLEVGSTATPFERRDYGRELIMCQRYFQKSYKQSDAVGTVTQDGMFRMYMNGLSSFTVGQYNIFFKTSFRATPTLTGYSPETGASGKYRDYNASTDRDFTAYYTTTEVSAWQNASITGTTTPNIGAQWTASSEL